MEIIHLPKTSESSNFCSIETELKSTTENDIQEHLRQPFFSQFLSYFNRNSSKIEKRLCLVNKSGEYNIKYRAGKHIRSIQDIYLTLLGLKWRLALLSFFIMYFAVLLFFTVIWCAICWIHGDFNHLGEPNYKPCVIGMTGFSSLLLFCIETQTSIGYGSVSPNTSCTGSLVVLYLQFTFGLIMETFLLTFIISKFFRPSKRARTIRFSENAVICQEDGTLCLQVRVGDLRSKPLQCVSVYGMLVLESVTDEGLIYPFYQQKLTFTVDLMQKNICLLWPVLLTHKITESSPFWTIGPSDLKNERFEIIIFLEGITETTGELCQARASYNQNEIFWGYHFQQILQFRKSTQHWCINFNTFDEITKAPTPMLSAKNIYKGSDADKFPKKNQATPPSAKVSMIETRTSAKISNLDTRSHKSQTQKQTNKFPRRDPSTISETRNPTKDFFGKLDPVKLSGPC